MTRYLSYSAGLHIILLLFLIFSSASKPKRQWYQINFVGGASGFGTGIMEPAPAPRKPAKKASSSPKKSSPKTTKSKNKKNKVAVAKKPTKPKKKKAPKQKAKTVVKKQAPPPSKAPAKKNKGTLNGKGESTKGKGDIMGSKTGPVGGVGTSLEIGGFGPGGGGTFNTGFPYTWYVNLLYKRLWESWDRRNAGTKECSVSFIIERDGSLSSVNVTESSHDALFDLMAKRAVESSAPFPSLPEGYTEPSLPVLVRFRLQ